MPIIETEADLLRLLNENEEFLTPVRSKILTDELLRLPARMDDADCGVDGERGGDDRVTHPKTVRAMRVSV